jgi:hypothetical protein
MTKAEGVCEIATDVPLLTKTPNACSCLCCAARRLVSDFAPHLDPSAGDGFIRPFFASDSNARRRCPPLSRYSELLQLSQDSGPAPAPPCITGAWCALVCQLSRSLALLAKRRVSVTGKKKYAFASPPCWSAKLAVSKRDLESELLRLSQDLARRAFRVDLKRFALSSTGRGCLCMGHWSHKNQRARMSVRRAFVPASPWGSGRAGVYDCQAGFPAPARDPASASPSTLAPVDHVG